MNSQKLLRVVDLGSSVLVLGTREIVNAARALHPEHGTRWDSSNPELFVRRNRAWVVRSDYLPPKDARPGVLFIGVSRDNTGRRERS